MLQKGSIGKPSKYSIVHPIIQFLSNLKSGFLKILSGPSVQLYVATKIALIAFFAGLRSRRRQILSDSSPKGLDDRSEPLVFILRASVVFRGPVSFRGVFGGARIIINFIS